MILLYPQVKCQDLYIFQASPGMGELLEPLRFLPITLGLQDACRRQVWVSDATCRICDTKHEVYLVCKDVEFVVANPEQPQSGCAACKPS